MIVGAVFGPFQTGPVFPLQEATGLLDYSTHARRPQFSSFGRRDPAESAHEGHSYGKDIPKLGQIRRIRGVFGLLFADWGKKQCAIG